MQQVYSQNNEQQIILNYFGDRVGTFLSLGENDGETLSNVRALALNEWDGVVVEPSKKAFAKLQTLYDDTSPIQCIRVAAGEEDTEAKFYESGMMLGVGDESLVSTIVREELSRWPLVEFTEYPVRVCTIKSLLNFCHYSNFNFISIDCEGLDLAILKQMDLRSLGCELLCVEWNSKNRAGFDAVVVPQGYKAIHVNSENIIYAIK